MKSSCEDKSIEEITYSMKLIQLKELIKIFEIYASGKRKKDLAEIIACYIKNNISLIVSDFITYEEYIFIKKICDNDYKVLFDEDDSMNVHIIKSLESFGIIYVYDDCHEKRVYIPIELREKIKLGISKVEVMEHSKENQKLIELVKTLLDIYGVISQDLLLDYITQYFDMGYKVHEAIKNLWRYNFRYNLYYNDYQLNYCNIKIIDKKSLDEKLSTKLNINYKYYNKDQLKNIRNNSLNCIEEAF